MTTQAGKASGDDASGGTGRHRQAQCEDAGAQETPGQHQPQPLATGRPLHVPGAEDGSGRQGRVGNGLASPYGRPHRPPLLGAEPGEVRVGPKAGVVRRRHEDAEDEAAEHGLANRPVAEPLEGSVHGAGEQPVGEGLAGWMSLPSHAQRHRTGRGTDADAPGEPSRPVTCSSGPPCL
jgi:hypothetical protein